MRPAVAIQWRLGYVHLAGVVMDAGDELVEPFHEEGGVRLVYHGNDLDTRKLDILPRTWNQGTLPLSVNS